MNDTDRTVAVGMGISGVAAVWVFQKERQSLLGPFDKPL
jgi:hypothetical protein